MAEKRVKMAALCGRAMIRCDAAAMVTGADDEVMGGYSAKAV